MNQSINDLLTEYKNNHQSVFNTWFIKEERTKNFRSIRSGVAKIVERIKDNTFGNDYKGSALEVVVSAIAEQKQLFAGANHPFVWKPKLRIPDIYENYDNQLAFAELLETSINSSEEKKLLSALEKLVTAKIKGLGPAITNILYFLHPTVFPAFNTAIVRGFNGIFNSNIKLGDWEDYFDMRDQIIKTNKEFKGKLSKDLGDISGLLYEVGIGRLKPESTPEPTPQETAQRPLEVRKANNIVKVSEENEHMHTKVQWLLIDLGRSLGYDVWVARNDRTQEYAGQKFMELTMKSFPKMGFDPQVVSTLELIDVIWFRKSRAVIDCAFEIEHSTSIYSGIVRLADLAKSIPNIRLNLYLVAPDSRQNEVVKQLQRPVFSELEDFEVRYILYNNLCKHCDDIKRFGSDYKAIDAISCSCTDT